MFAASFQIFRFFCFFVIWFHRQPGKTKALETKTGRWLKIPRLISSTFRGLPRKGGVSWYVAPC